MSNNNQYKYENESSIHSKLICTICLSPFNKLVSTICGHTFCISCIQQWLEEKSSCPICRHVIAKKYCTNIINQNILEEVNQLEVKCTLCEQNNIKRQDFDYHVNHQCTKAVISCPAADKQCSWTGQRKDLPAHEKICCYRQNQRILGDESKQNKIRVLTTRCHIVKLEDLIHSSPLCSKINLNNQYVTDEDIRLVIKLAIINKQCKTLDLGSNRITWRGLGELAQCLETNTTLQMLSLNGNALTETGIRSLAKKLSSNNSLKSLYLECSNLNDTCVKYLAKMLTKNTTLSGLWLSSNRIGYDGIKKLSSALANRHASLTYLDLQNNRLIDDSCSHYLKVMFEKNESLKTVHLNNCRLSTNIKTILQNIGDKRQNFSLFL